MQSQYHKNNLYRTWRRLDDNAAPKPQATHEFDVDRVRNDFPILSRPINGKKLVYLDNAATSQKPEAVIAQLPATMNNRTPTSIVGYITSPHKRRTHMKQRGKPCSGF